MALFLHLLSLITVTTEYKIKCSIEMVFHLELTPELPAPENLREMYPKIQHK